MSVKNLFLILVKNICQRFCFFSFTTGKVTLILGPHGDTSGWWTILRARGIDRRERSLRAPVNLNPPRIVVCCVGPFPLFHLGFDFGQLNWTSSLRRWIDTTKSENQPT
jgi:hypothetical protein